MAGITKSTAFVGALYCEFSEDLQNSVNCHLDKERRSRIGEDICHDTFAKLLVEVESGKLQWINDSNWKDPVALAALKGWTFRTAQLTRYESIRDSRKFDHGTEGIESVADRVETPNDRAEEKHFVLEALEECSAREREFWAKSGMQGRSNSALAQEWDITEGAVRAIRCRLLAWLRSRLLPVAKL